MPKKTKSPRVLIVDCESVTCRNIQAMLEAEGYVAVTATDGRQALDLIRADRFDVILLGLLLPKISGFQVLEKMKQWKTKTPVMVVSDLSHAEDIERAYQLGVKLYFVKAETNDADIAEAIRHELSTSGRVRVP